MERRDINPTPWLQQLGIQHGIEVTALGRALFISGQTSTAADGSTVHPDDYVSQFQLAWSNLRDVLAEAGMTAENVIRLVVYTTEMAAFRENAETLGGMVAVDGTSPTMTLVGVTELFEADLKVEIEATAVA